MSFLLVVTDRDQETFTIEGPMIDDTVWVNAVYEAQHKGRNVNCHTPGPGSVEEVAARMRMDFPYRYVPAGSIVQPNRG
jgi:hypothetical protein